MEPEGSSQCSQQPATGHCSEPGELSAQPVSLICILTSLHLRLGLPISLFPSSCPTRYFVYAFHTIDACSMSLPSYRS